MTNTQTLAPSVNILFKMFSDKNLTNCISSLKSIKTESPEFIGEKILVYLRGVFGEETLVQPIGASLVEIIHPSKGVQYCKVDCMPVNWKKYLDNQIFQFDKDGKFLNTVALGYINKSGEFIKAAEMSLKMFYYTLKHREYENKLSKRLERVFKMKGVLPNAFSITNLLEYMKSSYAIPYTDPSLAGALMITALAKNDAGQLKLIQSELVYVKMFTPQLPTYYTGEGLTEVDVYQS